MPKKYTFIDLFAGCGGLSEGFLASSKFDAIAHVEWELPMVETLRQRLISKWNHSQNDAQKSVVHFDIQKTDELINGSWSVESQNKYSKTNHESIVQNGLKGLVKDRHVNLIIGGPPCQAYSIAGRAQDKNSMKDDYRNFLFESFVKVVDEFKPELFVFENVPGLLSAYPGNVSVTKRIFEAFDNIGYVIRDDKELKKSIYTASDFGVPQKRKRVIIIGVRKNTSLTINELYEAIDQRIIGIEKKNVKDAIGNLPKLFPLISETLHSQSKISHHSSETSNVSLHHARYHSWRDIQIFKMWIENGMNGRNYDDKIAIYNEIIGRTSKHAKYRNLEWEKPSPTIVAHLQKDGLMFIHPDPKQARTITIREAAILQSFPNDYEFIGGQGFCYKMIGNAVPPLMAKMLAYSIYEILKMKGFE